MCGQKLHLHFEGGSNPSVSISTPNAVRPFGGLQVEVKMADAPISWGDPLPPINAGAIHWEAAKKVRYLKKNGKQMIDVRSRRREFPAPASYIYCV